METKNLKNTAAAFLIATGLVTHFEGKRLITYLDPPGIPTICYGHTKGIQIGMRATDDECKGYLQEDLNDANAAINKVVKIPIGDHMRAALLSFTLNVGAGNLYSSTLVKKLNAGNKVGACDELLKWHYSKGVSYPGLIRRREAERDECLKDT